MKFKLRKIILLLGDIIILYSSLYLALLLRNNLSGMDNAWETHVAPFTQIFFAWIFIFYISDIYNIYTAINNAKFYQRLFQAIATSSFLSILYFYANENIGIAPKTNLFVFVIILSLLMISWRNLFNWLSSAYTPQKKVLFIGKNEQIRELVELTRSMPQLGYSIKLILDEAEIGNAGSATQNLFGEKIGNLEKLITANNISTIVIPIDSNNSEQLRNALFSCLKLKINIISLPKFYESLANKVPIDAINQAWFLENLDEGNKKLFDLSKRICDIVFAVLLLITTLPFWIIISGLIKLDSRGSIFFKQKRLGRLGRVFSIIKFRTMRETDNDFAPTTSNDRRVTRLGSFLRKSRLDELPQLLNIIMNDMSFVGPRPERPEYARELEKNIPFYKERLLIKPGLTGLDQISGEYHSPSIEDTLKKMQYDLYYIKNRSFYLDLSIVLKTIMTVLSKAGV